MTTTGSQYGRVGALALAVGGIAFGYGVATHKVGTDPDALTQGIGYLSLALFVVGALALVGMMFSIYGETEL